MAKIATETEFEKLSEDVAYDAEKFKDPYVVGAMIHRLVEERKLTNELFKRIDEKLDRLVAVAEGMEKGKGIVSSSEFLSEVDEQIMAFVKARKRVCAEDVAAHLGYRGKNAASARLNALFRDGIVKKKRAGRKVFYTP
ncbi:MAG: hypothetical protein JW834_03625 [Candidatus Diapherotrites archaeon]|nr:hypothetical protein [Candidatus Diapherotrites archaeon]